MDYLLELALLKAESIKEIISKANLEPLREIAEENWVDYTPQNILPKSYAGVDGSHNKIDFKGFTLYALMGYSIVVDGDDSREYVVGDIDVLYPPGIPERIQLYRELAEAQAAYLSSNTELLMVDGSLRAILIHPRPLAQTTSLEKSIHEAVRVFGEDFFDEYWIQVMDNLEELREKKPIINPFLSRRIIRENYSRLENEDRRNVIILLEYLEKLMTIRRLLESSIRDDKPHIVYVSKTSRSQLYYSKIEEERRVKVPLLSDILIFTYFTKTPGYSKPVLQSQEERLKAFPSYYGLDRIISRFYDRVDYAITYIRLEEDGPVLKLEIPVWRDSFSEGGVETIIKWFMDLMSSISYMGYPMPLIDADKSSKITREDMHILAQSIGLLPSTTGREVLSEWL